MYRQLCLSAISPLVLSFALAGVGLCDEQSGKKVFEEDFEKGTDRWEILDPQTWKIATKDGNKTFEITARESKYEPPHRSPWHIALVKNLELADCTIEFRVRSTNDTGNHRDCCVFFDYQDDKHFYYVHLGALPDPHSGQIMIVNDAPRLALTDNKNKVPWDNNWHHVKLVRKSSDGEIAIYFDDMKSPVMKVNDKTFTKGRVGIGSFDDMNEFDDIVIYNNE